MNENLIKEIDRLIDEANHKLREALVAMRDRKLEIGEDVKKIDTWIAYHDSGGDIIDLFKNKMN